jgi:hypothetical protein
MFSNVAFNAKLILNTIASKEYMSIIKRANKPKDFRARIRIRYTMNHYTHIEALRRIFKALKVSETE